MRTRPLIELLPVSGLDRAALGALCGRTILLCADALNAVAPNHDLQASRADFAGRTPDPPRGKSRPAVHLERIATAARQRNRGAATSAISSLSAATDQRERPVIRAIAAGSASADRQYHRIAGQDSEPIGSASHLVIALRTRDSCAPHQRRPLASASATACACQDRWRVDPPPIFAWSMQRAIPRPLCHRFAHWLS